MLSKNQLRAISMAATGSTWIEVATKVGKSERTIHNWKALPEFKEELTRQRQAYLRQCMDTARSDVLALSVEAVECLRKAMKNGSVRAALAIAQGTGALTPPPPVTEEKIVVEFGDVTEDPK